MNNNKKNPINTNNILRPIFFVAPQIIEMSIKKRYMRGAPENQ